MWMAWRPEASTGSTARSRWRVRPRQGVSMRCWVEAYAGHGPRVMASGPWPLGVESVPEPPDTQAVVG